MKIGSASMQPQSMVTPCQACPLRPLRTFREFAPEELDFVSHFKMGELVANPGATILVEGESNDHLYTVLSGWSFRYKILPNGERQILNFALPGDFLGLQGSVFTSMGHSVNALTRTVLCMFPRSKLWVLYEKHPELAFDITWLASREERMIDEHLLAVGRRSGTERVAFLLLSLFYRCKHVGMVTERRTSFPLTQQHIADALGLSVVHTNKVLRGLSDRGYIVLRAGTLEITNETGMLELSQHPGEEPRQRPFI